MPSPTKLLILFLIFSLLSPSLAVATGGDPSADNDTSADAPAAEDASEDTEDSAPEDTSQDNKDTSDEKDKDEAGVGDGVGGPGNQDGSTDGPAGFNEADARDEAVDDAFGEEARDESVFGFGFDSFSPEDASGQAVGAQPDAIGEPNLGNLGRAVADNLGNPASVPDAPTTDTVGASLGLSGLEGFGNLGSLGVSAPEGDRGTGAGPGGQGFGENKNQGSISEKANRDEEKTSGWQTVTRDVFAYPTKNIARPTGLSKTSGKYGKHITINIPNTANRPKGVKMSYLDSLNRALVSLQGKYPGLKATIWSGTHVNPMVDPAKRSKNNKPSGRHARGLGADLTFSYQGKAVTDLGINKDIARALASSNPNAGIGYQNNSAKISHVDFDPNSSYKGAWGYKGEKSGSAAVKGLRSAMANGRNQPISDNAPTPPTSPAVDPTKTASVDPTAPTKTTTAKTTTDTIKDIATKTITDAFSKTLTGKIALGVLGLLSSIGNNNTSTQPQEQTQEQNSGTDERIYCPSPLCE